MCNIRIQILAGLRPPHINMQQVATQPNTVFATPSFVAIQRRRRYLNRFKRLPRRNGPMGRR